MKKLILIMALFTSIAQAKILTSIDYIDLGFGSVSRVVSWTPKDNSMQTCMVVISEAKATGITCYPKQK